MKKTISLVLAATIVVVVGTALLSSCEKEEITAIPTSDVQEKAVSNPMRNWVQGVLGPITIRPEDLHLSYAPFGYQIKTERTEFRGDKKVTIIEYDCSPIEQYPCMYGFEVIETPLFSGHVVGISFNGEDPDRLYYIFNEDVLEEEGIILENTLQHPYDVPIENSYVLDLAPANTTLSIPAGDYPLTYRNGGAFFSVAVDSLIRDTSIVSFK